MINSSWVHHYKQPLSHYAHLFDPLEKQEMWNIFISLLGLHLKSVMYIEWTNEFELQFYDRETVGLQIVSIYQISIK